MLLGAVAVVLGVTAHAGAGGAVAPAPSTLAAALLVGVLAAAGTGRGPLSVVRSVAVLGGGQLLLHATLTGGRVGHSHAASMTGMAMAPTTSGSADALMLGAHALVVLVVAALVSGADRSLARAVTALHRSVVTAVADVLDLARTPLPVADAAPLPPVPAPVGVGTGVLVARTHRRRGPPPPSCAPVSPGGRPVGPDPTSERTP